MLHCLLPIGFIQLLSSKDYVIPVVFRSKVVSFLIILFYQLFEIPTYDLFVDRVLVFSNVRNFQKHCRDHVNAI